MRNTKSVAFPHVSLARTPTHASRVAHIAVKDKGSTVVFLSVSGMERERERDREREQQQLVVVVVGVDRAAPAPHRRITLERTHHLCSFVELSHFNPRPGPFGNQLYTPPPNTVPHSRAPPTRHTHSSPAVSQPCHCQHFHLCAAAVVWCQCQVHTHTHTHFHQSHPNNWPASCLSRTPGVGGEDGALLFDVVLVCVPYIFTAI